MHTHTGALIHQCCTMGRFELTVTLQASFLNTLPQLQLDKNDMAENIKEAQLNLFLSEDSMHLKRNG